MLSCALAGLVTLAGLSHCVAGTSVPGCLLRAALMWLPVLDNLACMCSCSCWRLDLLCCVLADVTALLYDEQQHVIFTGSHAGVVHKWAPGGS
jgi:hypothetical protein